VAKEGRRVVVADAVSHGPVIAGVSFRGACVFAVLAQRPAPLEVGQEIGAYRGKETRPIAFIQNHLLVLETVPREPKKWKSWIIAYAEENV